MDRRARGASAALDRRDGVGSPDRVRRGLFGLLLAAVTLATGVAAAGEPDAYELKLLDELGAKNARAAESFRKANEARDNEQLELASGYYAEVQKLVPEFVPATRRRCGVERQLGHRDVAISLCR